MYVKNRSLCTFAFKFTLVHFRYTEAVESVTAEFLKRVNNLNKKNVFVIKGMEKDKQLFDSKKVHLTPEAGYDYLVQLLGEAETAFETEMEVVEEETEEAEDRMEVVVVPEAEKAKKLQDESGPLAQASGSQRSVQEQIDDIVVDIKERRHNDSMVLARIREEQDYQLNTKKRG